MSCAGCGFENPAGARFCAGCGASLTPRCPSCGTESPAGARFCIGCGAALAARAAEPAVARKTVTIVFADLIGSTALHERLDPESVTRLMDRYHRAVRAPIEAHGGAVMQLLGDGVMCAFGVPRVAEDDAIRAVRAAVDVHRSFREFADAERALAGELGLRVAINTGEVVVSGDQPAGIGDPLNVAARLQQEARDGDVLIGGETQRLVRELVTLEPVGRFALKGRAEPVAAFRVVSLERPAGVASTAFVGREDELRRLTKVYEEAIAAPAARLAVVLGSPGLGKSRLLAELARRLGEGATLLSAQCNAAGGATFAPLAEALRAHFGLPAGASAEALRAAIDACVPGDDAERARIAAGIGALLAGTPASPEETFFVVRRLLAALAAARPVVLAIDDLQWAEPLLLDLTEHLVQWGAGVPLLVLAAARPELRAARSSLTSPGGLVADVVALSGLDAGAATRLAANVIGSDALPAAVAGRVLATSEGNPLFLGELVRMLVNDGALKREGERWTLAVELAHLEMPPTIQALLAARIERLRPEERVVLERAAVVGRQFSRSAVAHLLPREAQAELDARLESLRRSELIEPDTGWLLGEPALRFHHVLIRDAAYRSLLRNTRAELHARHADWLVARAGESVEHDETIGWHLEQAHQHLRELGPLDADGRALGERAARYLAAAGRRALARDDLPPAGSLLGRALARLDAADPARADLALDWCEALLAAGEVATAARALAELERLAADSERLRAWHTCFSGQLAVLSDPQALRASAEAVAAAATTLTTAGDVAGEAKAHAVHALVLAQLGKIGACEAALDRALAAARRAGDRRRANAVLAGAPVAALWGPSPVTRASGRCLDVVRVLRITEGAPAVEAVALRCQAVLETLRGRGEAARRMIASSRQMVEELGITQRVLEADLFAGLIELLEGDAAAAEGWLRAAWDGLREQGLGIDAAQAAALLGRALLAQGRGAEAETLSRESEALAGDSFKAAIAWRGLRAEVLAARGEHAAAIDAARAAVDIAAATDDLLDHADARASLAVALRAARRGAEADAEQARAIELWEAKGATLLAERARGAAARGAESSAAPGARVPRAASIRRRIRPNAATAGAARVEAAVAARDLDALDALLRPDFRGLHRPTGAEGDRSGPLREWEQIIRAHDGRLRVEPLATLGDSLGLLRSSRSFSELKDGALEVGAMAIDDLPLVEVHPDGRARSAEIFADDRLGDAVARLYERYAELLPEGAVRERAAVIARLVASLLAPRFDLASRASAFSPDIEWVDHRTVGVGTLHGADAVLRSFGALHQLLEEVATRLDDVLDLRADAIVLRWTQFGTTRDGGVRFERSLSHLWIFGADGLLSRWEQSEGDRADELLARLDALTAATPLARRVRPNAASASGARMRAAALARDLDTIAAMCSDDIQVHHHPTGALIEREAGLNRFRMLCRAEGLAFDWRPLATLGDLLELGHDVTSFERLSQDDLSFGASRSSYLNLIDVNARGQCQRVEVFADDRLADAIARLYERYAELLPDGPERTRAAATARSVATMMTTPDRTDLHARALSPSVEVVDHRKLGTWSSRGSEAMRRTLQSLLDVSAEVAVRVDDVLALDTRGYLVRWTTSGTDRASGGAYERQFLMLCVFGEDGLLSQCENFDSDSEAKALARFDALLAAPPASVTRRVRPNAATAARARLAAAFAARDGDAITALYADAVVQVDHPTGATYGREGVLGSLHLVLRLRDTTLRDEPLATLGESLGLFLRRMHSRGGNDERYDAGEFDKDELVICEVDARGLFTRSEVFAENHLGDALACLYERHAELLPEGPERDRAAATARSVARALGPWEIDRLAQSLSPNVEYTDGRTLGFGSARGRENVLRILDSLSQVAETITTRIDDVLGLRADAFLVRWTNLGNDRSGGAYERTFLLMDVCGADGLVIRTEVFDADREGEALARFDALTAGRAPPARRVRPNAAIENAARLHAAAVARDADRAADVFNASVEVLHHPTGETYGREAALTGIRRMFTGSSDFVHRYEPLATLGETLALLRISWASPRSVSRHFDVGALEHEQIELNDVDAQGRRVRSEVFGPDRLGDAIVRLYERYPELLPDGLERERAAATARVVSTALGPFDVDRYATSQAPDVAFIDHRTPGVGSLTGAGAVRQWFGSLLEVAEGVANRFDEILGLRSDALLLRWTNFGTERSGGGRYERQFLWLGVFGADGRLTRIEQFETDHVDDALARFDALAAEPPAGNAAWRALARFERAWDARDWDGVLASYAPTHRMDDRRKLMRMQVSGEQFVANERMLFDVPGSSWQSALLATRGERLALCRVHFHAGGEDGGPLTVENLDLVEVDADGRRLELVVFDPEDSSAAYAELERRFAAEERSARIPKNAAIESMERGIAAVLSRSVQAFDFVRADLQVVHHPTGTSFDRQGARDWWRGYLADRDVAFRNEPLAALGASLSLGRLSWSGSASDDPALSVGAFEAAELDLLEVDAQGRFARIEVFATDRLGDAIVRLYERHAELLPEGPERIHAGASARLAAAWSGSFDPEGFAAALPPDIEVVDHRTLGTWSMRGAQALVQSLRGWDDLADGVTRRAEAILALRADALLARWTHLGTDRASGGAYERPFVLLWTLRPDGLVAHCECWDPDREAEALARFDALTAAQPPAPRFENAATRAAGRIRAAWASRDLARLAAVFPPSLRYFDRRRMVQLELDKAQALEFMRSMFELSSSQLEHDLVATRGDRLALIRVRVAGADRSIGPSEIESLTVFEVDERGEHSQLVRLDPENLDAAYVELDARFAAGEGAPYAELLASVGTALQAFNAADDETIRRVLPDDFVVFDHRPLVGTDGPVGRDAWFASFRSLGELAQLRSRNRIAHMPRLSATAGVHVLAVEGTVGGGAHAGQVALVYTHDGRRFRSFEVFELDQLDAAYARYEELSAAPPPRIENTATRHMERHARCWRERDWDGVLAALAPTQREEDRRAGVRLSMDADQHRASMRLIFENASVAWQSDLLATRGDRLALFRTHLSGEHQGARFTLDYLQVAEVDASGRRTANVLFDPDDLDAAWAELDARYDADEAAPYARTREALQRVNRGVAARDWELLTSAFAPDFAVEDHRTLGTLSALSRGEWVASVRSLAELRPDAALRLDHVLALDDRRALTVGTWVGHEADGAFEIQVVIVAEIDAESIRRWHAYDLDQLDAARACFAALGASAPRDPLAALARPNAAVAALDRLQAAYEARDWAAARALAAEGARWEDRCRHAQTSGDIDLWVASLKLVAENLSDAHYERRLVSTAGERVCVEQLLWSGGPADGRVEIEQLRMAEVDERGRLLAGVVFDLDDRRAAIREGLRRWIARDATAAAVMGPIVEFVDAYNDRDRARMRAALADDLVSQSHRLVRGLGRIEGADAFLDVIAVSWDLTPDAQIELVHALALERHGGVGVTRQFGTLAEGGGFERFSADVVTVARGRLASFETFEQLEKADVALARLAELRPDPLRIPPNAATRARDRQQQAREAGDWDGFAALVAPEMVFDDRRRGIRLSGDRETFLASARVIANARTSRTLLATAGERLALDLGRWHGAGDVPAFELEMLNVWEVDAEGRVVALITFDVDERRAAARELLERHARGEPGRAGPPSVIALRRAMLDRDLQACRAALLPDMVFHDHRRGRLGRLEGADAWLAWLATLFAESPDSVSEPLYFVESREHGSLTLVHTFGTLAEGGAFETVYVSLWLWRDGRLVGLELFEPEDLERARARLEEFGRQP